MANPQKENGYTPIANEILDEIVRVKLNATQFKILILLWRQTYGYSRKHHEISETFIAKATGLHKHQINREIQGLIKSNIVSVVKPPTYTEPRVLAFNKNYHEWQQNCGQSTNLLTVNELDVKCDSESVDTTVNESVDQKSNSLKTKNNICISDDIEELWKVFPTTKGKSTFVKKMPKLVEDHGFEIMMQCIQNYKDDVEADRKRNFDRQWMQGGSFVNGKYQDYLPENYNSKTAASVEDINELTLRIINGY